MEPHEDAEARAGVDSSVGSEFSPAPDIFRLMKLVRETQCEMEVVKPVLDELEVMRLCRGFGMMSSVNPKDFNFDVLHAREFDDDFIRFLRYELLESLCPGDVKLKGLFGKQAQVADALVDMGACAANTVASLAVGNEGVYCVKVERKECGSGLVVFSWIREELFEPQEIRNTAAFVLRFLTGLAPDVICCTTSEDLEQIKTAMTGSDDHQDDELSSYSVSFHIEKQEDQPDSTECVGVTSIDLEALAEDCSSVCLLKGSYPALACARTMNSVIRMEQVRRTFHSNMQLTFAKWLKKESQHYRIDLSPSIVRSVKLCRNILIEFDMWPEGEVNALRCAHEKQQQEEYKAAAEGKKAKIDEQRAKVDQVSETLFQLRPVDIPSEEEPGSPLQAAYSVYESFREWLRSFCTWQLDRKIELILDTPSRLRHIEAALYQLYSCGQDEQLGTLLEMCATSSKADLLKYVNKRCKGKKQPTGSEEKKTDEGDGGQTVTWEAFLDKIAQPLTALRTKWWVALQSALAAVHEAELKRLTQDQKRGKTEWYDREKVIREDKLDQLRKSLLATDGLLLTVNAHPRGRGAVHCEGVKEVHTPPTAFLDIVKLDASSREGRLEHAAPRQEALGRLLLPPDQRQVAMFTVKVRSAIQICTGKERMCAKFISFPQTTDPRRPPRASERDIRTFGQFASLCDYDARNRIMAFLSKDSVGVYKFDESFKSVELMKSIDLGVRSTLTELPFTDILLQDSSVYVTDSNGLSQAIDIHNDQTSNVLSVHAGPEVNGNTSRVFELADSLAIGIVALVPDSDGAFEVEVQCVSRDDHRRLPTLPLGVKFLTDRVSVQCVDDKVLVLDPLVQKVHVFSIQVSVGSDSYRMRQSNSGDSKSPNAETSNADCPRKQHWLYTFYHVFEKFPVRGLLDCTSPTPVSIAVSCPVAEHGVAALENFHDFLSLLMSDLMALSKPLHGLDLTKGLTVLRSLRGVDMGSSSLKAFFLTLITFLPIQICRAEGNALTVLHDGVDQSFDEVEVEEIQTWGAADIAESIRFGVLSPLLCAWRGRCVVITSMGKQSTGKSYFLNHLTGSSFAIAGNRCTDGAWMSLRVMHDVLLVVLDFEGLGSFERTDQEDVFLSVLNASMSMFTIFRMEMRFDKDIDGLFTKFQKGINLLKNDERLFRGSLYMSVKDVNPNDRHGVLSEFQRKFQKLLTANREQNFLTEMYSGRLGINCSPPLGTSGYYDSLRHARQLIEMLLRGPESSRGFKSGSSFHDCIRLVLAKISILDWTAVDESSQRLEMNELHRKLPGAIRTGCVIPVDAQTKEESILQSLKDPLLSDERSTSLLDLEQLGRDYPKLADCWASVDQKVSLDGIDDEDIDFGPSVCAQSISDTSSPHSTLLGLFQRYLALTSKGTLKKITDQDYANFDAMLSFLVCRRKAKVILWVKQFLGSERFMDEWEKIEQIHLLPFETLLKRCLHRCSKCQLQCMRSACHSFGEEHDCGMSHVCRGLCEYCMRKYQPGKGIPRCVGKAGHEGDCDCLKGDHTCGAECSLAGASNCGGICVLVAGHDEDHRCSAKKHACGAQCSATDCGGRCILNTEHPHSVHKCAEVQCNHACQMDACKERCSTTNHFHDQPEMRTTFVEENGQDVGDDSPPSEPSSAIVHLCSSRHACTATCEADGICTKSVQVSTSKFSGSCDTFDFDLKEMVGVRNKCAVVLPPGQINHDGVAHSCVRVLPNGTASVHGCDVKCAACEYYCDKPVGHEGEHSAAHGNMRNMHFVAQDADVIAWEDRKYAAGEKGVAEMCNMCCSTAGRGHVHYLKCDKDRSAACVYTGLHDQRRHCRTELKPQPAHEVDEVLHEKYWKTIGWEDPCRSGAERLLFGKCPYQCDAVEHKGEGKAPSCCDLDAWHLPVTTPPSSERRGFSYVSGHRFECSHAASTGKVHHVFVLDCSGSMRGEPWQKLTSALRKYLHSRMVSGARDDIVSVATFGNQGIVEYEQIPITRAPNCGVVFHGGGTFYSNGLSQANAILSRTDLTEYKPVMIFFTDGRPADRKKGRKMAVDVRDRYAKYGLRVFVVGFGRASELGLADLAEKLGGSVHEALTAADLGETFRSISMSLGARAGLIQNTSAA